MPNKSKAKGRATAGDKVGGDQLAAARRGNGHRPDGAPPEPTRAEVLVDIRLTLDAVDDAMGKRPLSGFEGAAQWSYAYGSTFGKLGERYAALKRQLCAVLEGQAADGTAEDAEDAISGHFTAPPGEALTWSRPGSFLAWMGDIPVRCVWGGFALRERTAVFALDPRRLFVDAGGSYACSVYSILPNVRSPEAYMREQLDGLLRQPRYHGGTSARQGQLVQLDRTGAAAAAAFLADPANAWWQDAMRSAPVEAVAIPASVKPVQKSLFG